jgi:hypothetical protein
MSSRSGTRSEVDIRTQLIVLLSKRSVQIGVAAGVSFAAGFALSKQMLEKDVEAKYAQISNEEIEQARRFYKTGEYSDPLEMAASKYPDEVQALGYSGKDEDGEDVIIVNADPRLGEANRTAYNKVEPSVVVDEAVAAAKTDSPVVVDEPLEPVQAAVDERIAEEEKQSYIRNVWDNATEDVLDAEAELAQRESGRPYVVTTEEHMEGVDGYDVINLTYYAPNDLLLDHMELAVEDPDRLVGNENLLKFGQGSGDENVVYIRNEELAADIEIIRSSRSYEEESGAGGSDD